MEEKQEEKKETATLKIDDVHQEISAALIYPPKPQQTKENENG